MSRRPQYVLTGIFVLVLGFALIWGVLWISAGGTPQRHDRYEVYMRESVSGLNVDSALKFRGVDVGKVEKISIDPQNPERIRLLLLVQSGIPIKEDTIATLEYQGLTGLANINLKGGTANSPLLTARPGAPYPVIPTEPSLFSRLDTTTSELLASLLDTSASLNALLNPENRQNLGDTFASVATLTANLARQSARLDEMLANLDETLRNARTMSVELPGLAARFGHAAEAVDTMADEVALVAQDTAKLARRIDALLLHAEGDMQQLSTGAVPALVQMAEELRLAAGNLNRASESLARDPAVLIYGNGAPPPGPGEKRD